MTAIEQSLGEDVCEALPGMHALTGCDSTIRKELPGMQAYLAPFSRIRSSNAWSAWLNRWDVIDTKYFDTLDGSLLFFPLAFPQLRLQHISLCMNQMRVVALNRQCTKTRDTHRAENGSNSEDED